MGSARRQQLFLPSAIHTTSSNVKGGFGTSISSTAFSLSAIPHNAQQRKRCDFQAQNELAVFFPLVDHLYKRDYIESTNNSLQYCYIISSLQAVAKVQSLKVFLFLSQFPRSQFPFRRGAVSLATAPRAKGKGKPINHNLFVFLLLGVSLGN